MTVDQDVLRDVASTSDFALYRSTGSSPRGLTQRQADERLVEHGENVSRREPTPTPSQYLRVGLRSPFVALLGSLGLILGILGDQRGAITVAVMVVVAAWLRAWQHGRAVAALCVAEPSTATVRRRSDDMAESMPREVLVDEIVVGDVVLLQAGDVVPADVRITSSRALIVDQSVTRNPRWYSAGTTVVSGTASAVVVGTGSRTCSKVLRHDDSRRTRKFGVGWARGD